MSEQAIKMETGFLGYFDILGYQSFLENNSPESAAKIIIDTLLTLHKEMPQGVLDALKKVGLSPLCPTLEPMIREIKWLVFSDTILLSMGLDPTIKGGERSLHFAAFMTQCSYLWENMFNSGLPLRGVITGGSFAIQKTCFVGRPIVNACKLTTQLSFAGCVITPEAFDVAERIDYKEQSDAVFFYKYAVPQSGNQFEPGYVLNGVLFRGIKELDLRQAVHESFWKHGKDLGTGVQDKIEQTERYLRFLKMRHPFP